MAKSYKDYCREAMKRDPKTYGSVFKKDGSLKPAPKMSDMIRRLSGSQKEYFKMQKKDGWKPEKENKQIENQNKKPVLEITGTEVKLNGRIVNLKTLQFPENCSRKEYKRIWMHNQRVKKRIKKLKETYGKAATL